MKLSQLSSCTTLCILSTATASVRRELFVRSTLKEAPPVDFQQEWVHDFDIQADVHTIDDVVTELRSPHFVPTFDFVGTSNTTSIQSLALQAKHQIIQDTTGAILFRGLNKALHNVSEFAAFWSAMQWRPVEHVSCYNRKRESASIGVDFVDTDVPQMVLGPHNEHACNPNPTGRIAFYGFQPADHGGESLVRHNSAIEVPDYVTDFVREHGGIQTTRVYADHDRMMQDKSRYPTSMSWQERCGTNSKQDCKDFFSSRGMTGTKFDEDDTLTVTSVHPGWLDGSWFNHIEYGFPTKCADGTDFPREWQMEMKKNKWAETFAYKLQEGDWLVLDNRSVQHGRLPYEGKRLLIVSYTDESYL
eukprot:CAMPEP_0119011408 /NCGR_PEP_ID=MMETSP1176-20130426/5664_1 /TAXON_ID=265551 /ORGANISM="Synedropsis recta cf, Strain CCMP1620" /LENGTH=359 /DNA_ID=CAMNT_0006964239 /DNA_START=10 /DNA_END=1089 /DNA_ORIENTATION=-